MMRIEATVRVRYRWPEGEVVLEPGIPVNLPDDRARRLLAKAPKQVCVVRAVDEPLQAGDLISWRSPVVGIRTGELAMQPEQGWIVVRCPSETVRFIGIPQEWMVRR
jgi:hypothetical protein